MHKIIGTAVGKTVRILTKLKGGDGQALPGLVVERLLPTYLKTMLEQLNDGVIIITGTNGKTTTTKMVVELLQANGKRVLTNPTGSNFTRGIISSLTQQAKINGTLPYDTGVFELDEAYARQFVIQIKPSWVLALNVMRDQLDRFGELDAAAKMVGATIHEATQGAVVNDDDYRLVEVAQMVERNHKTKINYFGVAKKLRSLFPIDDELVAVGNQKTKTKAHKRKVELSAFSGEQVKFAFGKRIISADLQVNGQHNFQNAAAALALVSSILPKAKPESLVAQIATVKPAFGRGEKFILKDGSELQLVLVKNPAGFSQVLASYDTTNLTVMIAINDDFADGRDVSWLWDVDFSLWAGQNISLTSGTRAADMALRLHYDDVVVQKVEPKVQNALAEFCKKPGSKIIFATYTAMTACYTTLKKQAGKTL